MRLLRTLPILLIALYGMALADTNEGKVSPAPTDDKITWIEFDDGLAKAKKENKHVFIDFTAKWCGWCKKMDREVFVDKRVVDILKSDFVTIKVDGDSENLLDIEGYKISEKNLAKQEFQVSGYPAFWFLKSDGTKLGVLKGYQQTDQLVQALEYVREYRYDTTRVKTPENSGK